MAKLIINPGTASAKEFELKPGSNLVGRGFANDLKLEDSSVSSSHAEIVLAEDSITIKDLGSTNGTFLNRQPIKQAAWQPGQSLHLGGVEIRLQTEIKPALPVAAAVPTAPPAPVASRVEVPSVTVRPLPGGVRIGSEENTVFLTRAQAPAPPSAPPPPPPISAPPTPIPTAPQAAAAPAPAHHQEPMLMEPPPGKSACKYHPKSAGQWFCRKCDELFCSVCVITQRKSSGTTFSCRICGTNCVPVRITFTAAKEKEAVVYSDSQLLTRAVLFGFGASMVMVLIWTGVAWLLKTDVPFVYCILSGFLCGYAVKLGVQDQPSVVFSLIACGFCLLGVLLGKVGMVIVTQNYILFPGMTIAIFSLIGLVIGLFLAWKFGGGDF